MGRGGIASNAISLLIAYCAESVFVIFSFLVRRLYHYIIYKPTNLDMIIICAYICADFDKHVMKHVMKLQHKPFWMMLANDLLESQANCRLQKISSR